MIPQLNLAFFIQHSPAIYPITTIQHYHTHACHVHRIAIHALQLQHA